MFHEFRFLRGQVSRFAWVTLEVIEERSVKLHDLGQMVKRGLDRQLTLDNRMAEVAKIEGIKVEGV